jgi:hypothetical protein
METNNLMGMTIILFCWWLIPQAVRILVTTLFIVYWCVLGDLHTTIELSNSDLLTWLGFFFLLGLIAMQDKNHHSELPKQIY